MKISSFFTFGTVVIVFLIIQGWVLTKIFILPRTFIAMEAVMMGDSTEVRTPVQGMIKSVNVKENERVMTDQTLFVVTSMVTNPDTQEIAQEDFPILALGPGIITDINVRNGLYVQSVQKLATIIDNSSDALYVRATIPVEPKDVPRIQPRMSAKVRANFLFDGSPVGAMVTAVEPRYDAKIQMLTVRLRLFRYPDGMESLPLGLPVEAWLEEERRSNDNIVIAAFRTLFPNSEAQSQ